MAKIKNRTILRIISLLIIVFLLDFPAYTKYSGGTGEPNDPYQIATAEDLKLLGETPGDCDKHFVLTADIDLDPNLPGRKVLDKAVIAADIDPNDEWGFSQGTYFTGVFDGNGYTIRHLTIVGAGYLGLFGQLGSGAIISNLGLEAVDINGTGSCVGGLVGGDGWSSVTNCYSTGTVAGDNDVGGLVGSHYGTVTKSYSFGTVNGNDNVGGLVGSNGSYVSKSYSSGVVSGNKNVGGLVGLNRYAHMWNQGEITDCYSTCTVDGIKSVGGLLGYNGGGGPYGVSYSSHCYSTGGVSGSEGVGGLVGENHGSIWLSFWDIDTSGQSTSAGGIGKTTEEMQRSDTFLEEGWDFVGETENGTEDIWKISEGLDYPRLWWEKHGGGTGEPNNPYLIYTAEHLNEMSDEPNDWDKHFKLMADIDLSEYSYDRAVIAPDVNDTESGFQGTPFTGVFDGNGHTISHLMVTGEGYLGLFGELYGKVKNLGVVDVNITGSGDCVGGITGINWGSITMSYSTATVSGNGLVGGLVGWNGWEGNITMSYSTGTVGGDWWVGGLAGCNDGNVTQCRSSATVKGGEDASGGLIGNNQGYILNCYSTGDVNGINMVGGLTGRHQFYVGMGPALKGIITASYSTGAVTGDQMVGGLAGGAKFSMPSPFRGPGDFTSPMSFWDMETSGQLSSLGGTGKTTEEMQRSDTFLEEGWDFVGETENGTEDIWKISEGLDYPRLWWEKYSGGTGEPNEPYQIATAEDLILLGASPEDYDKHFIMIDDIDLDPNLPGRKVFDRAVIAPTDSFYEGIWFTGVYDGNGYTISHLTIAGDRYLGLFGLLGSEAEVSKLGLEAVDVNGTGGSVGGLAGINGGNITTISSTGAVSGGGFYVGGLVGWNYEGGTVIHCYSTAAVEGGGGVGGLVGWNDGSVSASYSTGNARGIDYVGGLVGANGYRGPLEGIYVRGTILGCYSVGNVLGETGVGGLVGDNILGVISDSFWDIQSSRQAISDAGTGLTTAAMQTASTFLEAGWDFVDETENGTEDIWWILEGQDYPRLWWEAAEQ